MTGKILVTPRSVTRSGHPSLEKLRQAGYEIVFCTPGVQPGIGELRALLPGCIGYLAGVEPITADALTSATDLRVISRNGTGVDSIDLEAARSRGILVLRADGANARGVAELAVGQLFALARRVPRADAALKRGAWERPPQGMELEGKTLGLVGCGRIGKLVAQMVLPIGMTVLAYDPFPDGSFAPAAEFRYAPLEDVIAHSDFLSLHCPPTADGRPLFDTIAFGRMKRGVLMVNTARFDVLDGEATLNALESGHLGGIALDVFDTEPPTDVRLAQHPNVIATPHIGAFTSESIDRAMDVAVVNLIEALNKLNPQ